MKNECQSLSSSELNEVEVLADPQDGSDKNRAAQSINGCAAAVYDTWNNAAGLCRQAEVITHGIIEGGTKEFAHEVAKRPVETGINVGLSFGLGIGLSYLQLRHNLAHKVVGTIAGLFGIKATVDGFQHISKNQDFTSSLDAAYSHGDKATMERSKAIAVKVLAPEVVQLEVGALAGGVGYSGGLGLVALKNKTFAQPWSKLMQRAAECLQRNKVHGAPESVSPKELPAKASRDFVSARENIHFEKSFVACDEQGIPLAEATSSERKIITEYIQDLQTLAAKASPRLRLAIRKQDGSLELDCDTWYAQPKKPHEASSDRDLLEEVIPKLNSEKSLKYGTKVKEAFFGYNPSHGDVLLNSEFLEANYVCPDWRLALIDQSEISFYDRSHNLMRPVLRPNDMERIVLECVRHHIGKTLPEISFMAQRTIGPASGRTVGPIMLEILTSKEPTPDLRLKLDVIMEKVYKQLRIRPDYRFAEHECETWPLDYDSVPLSLEHISKTSYVD